MSITIKYHNALSELCFEYRKKMKWSQNEMAERMGLGKNRKSLINRLEKNQQVWVLEKILGLAKAMNKNPEAVVRLARMRAEKMKAGTLIIHGKKYTTGGRK